MPHKYAKTQADAAAIAGQLRQQGWDATYVEWRPGDWDIEYRTPSSAPASTAPTKRETSVAVAVAQVRATDHEQGERASVAEERAAIADTCPECVPKVPSRNGKHVPPHRLTLQPNFIREMVNPDEPKEEPGGTYRMKKEVDHDVLLYFTGKGKDRRSHLVTILHPRTLEEFESLHEKGDRLSPGEHFTPVGG